MTERRKFTKSPKFIAAVANRSQNPKYLASQQAAGKKRVQNSEWLAAVRAANKRLHANPEHAAKIKAAMKKAYSNSEYRAKVKAAGKKRAQNPDWQKAVRAAGQRRTKDPEWQKLMRTVYASPEWYAKILKAANREDVIARKRHPGGPQDPSNPNLIRSPKAKIRYEQGLCRYCTRPRSERRKECSICFERFRERRRRYYQRKKVREFQNALAVTANQSTAELFTKPKVRLPIRSRGSQTKNLPFDKSAPSDVKKS